MRNNHNGVRLKKKTELNPLKGELRNSLIAVMDIMGFSSILKNNAFNFGMLVTNLAVDGCLKHVKASALIPDKTDPEHIKDLYKTILHFQFSDTLILVMPEISKTSREAQCQFFVFVNAVAWAVSSFFDRGFPVQCQIEYGNCWWNMDENFLLGRQFIIAHEKISDMGFSGMVVSEDVLKIVFGNVRSEECRRFCRHLGIERITVPDKKDDYYEEYCFDWLHIRHDLSFSVENIRQELIEKFTQHGKCLTASVVKKIDNTENMIRQFCAKAKEYRDEEQCYK